MMKEIKRPFNAQKALRVACLVLADLILINLSAFLALYIRFEFDFRQLYATTFLRDMLIYAGINSACTILIFHILKLYNSLWEFASVSELVRITLGCFFSAVFYMVGMFMLHLTVPRSFPAIYMLILCLLCGALRLSYRCVRRTRAGLRSEGEKRTMLIGGGQAGAIALREFQTSPRSENKVVCIIDDSPNKVGSYLRGVKIVGGRSSIPAMAEKYDVDEIVLAIPSASRQEKLQILSYCHNTSCTLRTLPGICQLANGEVRIEQIREVDIEDLIPEETCVFTLTHEGYIKRTAVDTYSAQNRGGRGVAGMTQKDNDFTEELFVGSTHDYMLFMTDKGRVYRLKGYQVAEGSRTAKGSHIANLLQLQEGEKVTIMMRQPANMDEDASYITMVTRQGLIKRTPLSQFRNIRKGGLNAIALNEDDALVWCHLTGGEDELIVATHDGAAIHFSEAGARSMGRTGHGVRVIKLRDGDYVVGVGVCRPGATVLTVTEDGKGRRSLIDDYRITKRGGLGIRNYTRGGVAGIKIVDDTDDLILISQDGILIRMHANDINVQSRYGSGVRVMRLIGEDKVAVLARVDRDATAETAKPEDDGETDPTPEELEAIAAAEAAEEAAEDAAPDTEGEDEE